MSVACDRAAAASRAPACAHCSLPVPAAFLEGGAALQFCCRGCRAVHDAIHACGLEAFYALRDEVDAATPARVTGARYEAFDEPDFRERFVAVSADGVHTASLYLEGLHCAACVWLLERLPAVLDGVIDVRVDLGRRTARVAWDDARLPLSHIARRLDALGYPSHAWRESAAEELRRRENRAHLVRIGVAGACAGNVMLIAFALYGAMFDGMAPAFFHLFRWTSFALAVLALAWPGRVFLRGALSSWRTGVMHMDVPVALALVLGTAWGGWNTWRGSGHVYFESLTAVIFLLLVGRWIQFRQQNRARDALALLFTLTPRVARRLDARGEPREVPADALLAGDTIEVRPGDSVPADGVVVDGESELDLSLLTGESKPVRVGRGGRVHAGTTNLGRRLTVEVAATGAATRVGRLMRLVERFANDRPPLVRLADRVAHRFVIAVLVLAALTLATWSWLDPSRAVEITVTLLIVTCPCALGLATPLALLAAIGRAASAGIFIKGGSTLERLARPGHVVFDKTGTLTEGRMRLVSWTGPDEALLLAAAVEADVAHPVARALREAAAARGATLPPAIAQQVLGSGVVGEADGRTVVVGSPRFVRERAAAPLSPAIDAALDRCAAAAASPVLVAVDGAVAGVAGLGDAVRADALDSVDSLRALGMTVGLVSGDDAAVVHAAGDAVGIGPADREGAATPERKVESVRRARSAERVTIMVGDGVNDAAALAAADVGIAVSGGAEASLEAADVYLRAPGLLPLAGLIAGARRAVRVVKRNVAVSVLYNAVAGSLAVTGLIDPMIAAILMPLSSLSVVAVSYRSRTFEAG